MNKVLQQGQQEPPGAEAAPGWPRAAAALGVSSATSPFSSRGVFRGKEEKPDRTRVVRDPDRWGLFVFSSEAGRGCAMAGLPGLERGWGVGVVLMLPFYCARYEGRKFSSCRKEDVN